MNLAVFVIIINIFDHLISMPCSVFSPGLNIYLIQPGLQGDPRSSPRNATECCLDLWERNEINILTLAHHTTEKMNEAAGDVGQLEQHGFELALLGFNGQMGKTTLG